MRLWQTSGAQNLRTLTSQALAVQSVAFSPGGQVLASAGIDNVVSLWEVASSQHLRSLRGHTDQVSSVAFSTDGRTLASASHDGSVRLWQFDSGECMRTLRGGHTLRGVSFNRDGTIVAAAENQIVHLW